jgi:hypothetical protein
MNLLSKLTVAGAATAFAFVSATQFAQAAPGFFSTVKSHVDSCEGCPGRPSLANSVETLEAAPGGEATRVQPG